MAVNNTVPPSISGTARVGQMLLTSNGTWTFDLDHLTYSYEWLRCDAAGANCNVIVGQVNSTYTLTQADVGFTIRSRVTATEHAAAPGDQYFVGDFETGNVLQWPDLHDCPAAGRTIVAPPSTAGAHSNFAWRCKVSSTISSGTGGGPSNFVAHNVDAAWERPGELTFYRFMILFPTGTDPDYPGVFIPPTSASLNTVLAWHQTSVGSYSTHFGLNASDTTGNFFLQVAGGNTAIARQWFWDKQADNSTPIPIQYDTWGEVLVEVLWSHLGSIGSSPGYFKLWVDWGSGRRQVCPPASGEDVYGNPWPLSRPTLWRRASGEYDPVWLEAGQYRYTNPGGSPPITTETSVYLDDWLVGSTLASVGG